MTTPRVAIVTGAGSGIGRAIANRLAADGHTVAVLDLRAEPAEEVTAEIRAAGYQAIALGGVDASDREQIMAAVQHVRETVGPALVLVNNAGISQNQKFMNISPEKWDKMIAVNLTGPFNIVKAALPFLRQADSATIVNIASVSGMMPMAGTVGYSASKGGAIMFGKALAFDLGPTIRVNTICPGVIVTEMTRYLWESAEHTERAKARVALQRLGQVEDVARAALFFSTEDSGFTTGTELPVDGGFSWR